MIKRQKNIYLTRQKFYYIIGMFAYIRAKSYLKVL